MFFTAFCFCLQETAKKKRGIFGESFPSYHSPQFPATHEDSISNFGPSIVHQFSSQDASSSSPFYSQKHFNFLQPSWSLNSKYSTDGHNPSALIPVAASHDFPLPTLEKEIILTSPSVHLITSQENQINLFYPESLNNNKNIYLNTNNILGRISPAPTTEVIDEPPPPPAQLFRPQPTPTAKIARGLSLGSGSLGYSHLGNGVFALGSGSLGATRNNFQQT